ncbi:DUF3553 domain-containing protein [Brachymonas sp. M4Q-1]|uniref:DUF3553 domain-containing protein n=1 Tax=Brachymonas sp. M4Q-1 TaxID=3416906 RepID=UPI003CE6C07E
MQKGKKGSRVRHATKTEWGVGQLLEDANSQDFHIFFEGAGEKHLDPTAADKLIWVSGAEAESALLDNMHLPADGQSYPICTIAEAKERLLEIYPGGLHGQKMKDHERDYKDRLSALARQWYSPDCLRSALTEGRYTDVVQLAYQLVKCSENNLPASFEKMAFANAVKKHSRPKAFAEAFCAWVLPERPSQAAFDAFAKELNHMGCAKWPLLTIYRFLLHPEVDVLIKPTNLANAAKVARFEINYRPKLNWLTYSTVMAFYGYVKQQIADLQPKDMIDVQNFIWCIDPNYGGMV